MFLASAERHGPHLAAIPIQAHVLCTSGGLYLALADQRRRPVEVLPRPIRDVLKPVRGLLAHGKRDIL